MEWAIGLIGGLGIGSLTTSVVTHFMSRRATSNDRWYQEKREAYLGYLPLSMMQLYVPPKRVRRLTPFGRHDASCLGRLRFQNMCSK
jgi:hypothetical protein